MNDYGLSEDERGMEAAVERAREEQHPAPIPDEEAPGDELAAFEAQLGKPAAPSPAAAGLPAAAAAATRDEPPQETWAAIKHGLRENDTRAPPESPIVEKMKAVGWEPKASEQMARSAGAPRGWDALYEDLQAAERSADSQRSINAALHAAAPGFVGPANDGQGEIDAAKTALMGHEKLLAIARQQELDKTAAEKAKLDMEREQQQIASAKTAAETAAKAKLVAEAKEQARNDAGSSESKRARDALRPVFAMVGDVPADFESWSAADVEKHAKSLTPIATGAAMRKKTEAELAAKEKATVEQDTSLEGEKSALAADKRLAKLGVTPEMLAKMDRHGVDKVRDELGKLPKEKGTGAAAKPIHSLDDIRDPGDRNVIDAILHNKKLLSSIPNKSGERQRIAKILYQVDPNHDELKDEAYAAVQKQQALGKDVVAMDVGRHHIALAESALPDNADARYVNEAKQSYAKQTGDPKYARFNTASTMAAHEIATIMKVDDQTGKQMVEHMLEPVQSKAALREVFGTIDELIAGKQEGLKAQLQRFASQYRKPGEAAPAPVVGHDKHGAPILPSTSDQSADTVTVHNRKDPSKSRLMSRAAANKLLSLPGGDQYEVK